MRLNRTTLIALAVLLILSVGAVAFLNMPSVSSPAPDAENVSENIFPNVLFKGVRSVAITDNVAGSTITLSQSATDGLWSVVDNPNAAQQVAVDTAIANFVNIQSSNRFNADDLAPYGLVTPAYTIVISDSTTHTLRIGNRNPAGTRFYALVDDDTQTVYMLTNPNTVTTLMGYLTTAPVVVVVPTLAPALDTAGLLFPDADSQRITRLELRDTQANTSLMMFKDDDSQWVLDPFSAGYVAAPLDQQLAGVIVQVAATVSAIDVLKEVADPAVLGLEAPRYTLQLTRDDGFLYTLAIGSDDPSGARVYGRIYDLPNVAVLDRADVQSLLQFIGNAPYVLAEVTAESTPEATAEVTAAP